MKNDNIREREKPKKKSGIGGLVFIVAVFIINLLNEIDSGNAALIIAGIIILFALGIIFAVVFSIVKKSMGKTAVKAENSFVPKKKQKGFSMPAWNRDEVEIPLTRPARTVEPTVYDENAAEHNFVRDRERRINQLDGFLKNGIIDKKEYDFLKARYMKNYR